MEPPAHGMIYDIHLIILPSYAIAAAYPAQSANCRSVFVAMAYLMPDEAQDVTVTAATKCGGFYHPGCP